MALTYSEQKRLQNAEETIQELKTLIDGAGSRNMLERLKMLSNEQLRRVESRLTDAEAELEELITLARKLQ
jgi:hypothetical protein